LSTQKETSWVKFYINYYSKHSTDENLKYNNLLYYDLLMKKDTKIPRSSHNYAAKGNKKENTPHSGKPILNLRTL